VLGPVLPLAGIADMFWGVTGVVGGTASIFVLVWFAARGHRDRDDEDAARDFYDVHGRWPDET
jgi:hypothetical protein